MNPNLRYSRSFTLYAIALAISAGLFLSILHLGDIQFGGMDGGVLTNCAWQLSLGYKPYVDVVTGVPPLFIIGCRVAFVLFGVKWHSFVLITACFSAITFILQVIILDRLRFGLFWCLFVATSVQSITSLLISWWWYNQMTAVVGCLFASTALMWCSRPQSRLNSVALVIATAILSLTKPNVAGPLIILVFLVLLGMKDLRRRTIVISMSTVLLAMGVLFSAGVNVLDVINRYQEGGSRVLSSSAFFRFFVYDDYYEAVRTLMLLVPCILSLVLILSWVFPRRSSRSGDSLDPLSALSRIRILETPQLSIGLIVVGIGFWGMMTNNDFNMSDAALVLLGSTFIDLYYLRSANGKERPIILTLLLMSMVGLTAGGIQYGVLRYRVLAVGPLAFYEDAPLVVQSRPRYFKGVQVGPRMNELLGEIDSVLSKDGYNGEHNAPVFFGPRIDFAYAAFEIKPVPGIPLWWEAFSKDASAKTRAMVDRFKSRKFKMVILLRWDPLKYSGLPEHDKTFFPFSLARYLDEAYEATDRAGITVYKLRKEFF